MSDLVASLAHSLRLKQAADALFFLSSLLPLSPIHAALTARESNLPEPPSPPLFVKPRTAAAGPRSTIVVPRIASSYIDKPSGRKSATPQIDYEGELVVVIGKECKDVSRESAMDHVAGFAVGQDVSAREWQMNNGSQWCINRLLFFR